MMKKKLLLIALVSATTLGLNAQKLSPHTQALLSRFDGKKSTMLKSFNDTVHTDVQSVKVFLDITNDAVLDSIRLFGGKIFTSVNGIATAELPVSSLREISELNSIRYVDMGAPVHLCLDKVREVSGIDKVHTNRLNELPMPYDGSGVVVGVIDCGLDYTHIDFLTADGNDSRIKRIWNQNATGKRPEGFGYGAEYTSFAEMKAAKTDSQLEYHGSHTTGIAAGGDTKSAYYGAAPGADIVYVAFGENTADLPNAVQYIFNYAQSVGKPCVINMSLGSHMGPHDGTSMLDRFFESVTGPGRILVGSVGNEGQSNMHVGKTFTDGDTQLKTLLKIPSSSNKNTALDIWGSNGSEFTVQLVVTDTKGKILQKSEPISSSATEPAIKSFDNNVDCYFRVYPSKTADNGAPNMYIECYITTVGETRNLGVIISGEDGSYVNMWNLANGDFVNGGLRGWSSGDNQCTSGEIGGTGEAVISVGSYNSRFAFPMWDMDPRYEYTTGAYPPEVIPVGAVSFFSSCGPTIDGRMKPDVIAPGALVVSAMNGQSQYADSPSDMVGRTVDNDGKAHYYYLNIGTSMSSPLVAGGIALWLQAKPDLTPQQAKEAMKATSKRDTYTGLEPNNNAGFGKFDAYNGLKYLLNASGVNSVASDINDNANIWLEPDSRIINVVSSTPTQLTAYSITGAAVGSYDIAAGFEQINCSGWVPGVYILRIGTTGATKKIVIR